MNKSFLVFFTALVLFSFNSSLPAQETPAVSSSVAKMLEQGNAGSLAGMLNSRVDLELPGSSGIYSRSQAEEILKAFFKKHPPTAFRLKHSGQSGEKASYSIGQYTSGAQSFRVYYLMKPAGEHHLIHQLRFETQP